MGNYTVNGTGGALMGAGLVKVGESTELGLILIGVGVGLQVLVAVLNRYNVPISGR